MSIFSSIDSADGMGCLPEGLRYSARLGERGGVIDGCDVGIEGWIDRDDVGGVGGRDEGFEDANPGRSLGFLGKDWGTVRPD